MFIVIAAGAFIAIAIVDILSKIEHEVNSDYILIGD